MIHKMADNNKIKYTLMEEPLLYCLRSDGDFSIGPISSKMTNVVISAGIFMELALLDRLEVTKNGKKVLFALKGDNLTEDAIINSAIEIMKNEKEPHEIDSWFKILIGSLIFHDGIKDLKPKVLNLLVEKKVLSTHGKSYPFADTEEIKRVAEKLKSLANIPPSSVDTMNERDYCLLGLFYALDKPFEHKVGNALDINRIYPDKDERSKMRKNLAEIFKDNKSEDLTLNDTKAISTEVEKSIIRRMLRVMMLGMFHVFFNL